VDDVEELEARLADYRCDDAVPPRVDAARWASQFRPDEQATMLRVARRWVERYYWPRDRVVEALEKVAADLDDGPIAVMPRQGAGSGQATLNRLFDRILRERRVAKAPLTSGARVHVYLDDLCCTGRTLDRYLRPFVGSLAPGSQVVVFHLVEHTLDARRAEVERSARERGVLLRFVAGQRLENRPGALGGLDVVMPTPWAAGALAPDYDAKVTRRAFRERDLFGDGPLFVDADERDVVERALLRTGSCLARGAGKPAVRPLGFGASGTLGFGAVACTFHNAPNTMPLALWWSDGWFPLLPRCERVLVSNQRPNGRPIDTRTGW
jgi:hypothetical protein